MRAIGIDLGASAVWCVATEGGRYAGASVFGPGELHDLRRWCEGAVVAIDAPGGPSEGHEHPGVSPKFARARCAEVALGRAGHWVSWATGSGPFATWMEVGFAVWRALDELGPLEVFPHAVFAELLGRRPANKQTVDGRRQRLSMLPWLPDGAELWGHDGIDAAGACVVAMDFADGRARPVRCADHEAGSVMWLPSIG